MTDGAAVANIDITGPLVGAIAHCLWQARGGDSMTNWADAERALDQLLGAAPPPAPQGEMKSGASPRVAPPTPPAAPRRTVQRR